MCIEDPAPAASQQQQQQEEDAAKPEQAPAAAEEAARKPAGRAGRRPAQKEAATIMQVQLRPSMPTQGRFSIQVTFTRALKTTLKQFELVSWNAGRHQGQAKEGQARQVSSQRPDSSR